MTAPLDPDQYPRPSRPSSVIRVLGVTALVVAAAVLVLNLGSNLGRQVGRQLDGGDGDTTPTVAPGLSVEVEIPFGSSATRVAEILQESGVIAEAAALLSAVQDAGVAGSIQAGSYQLTAGTSIEELLVELLAGPVATTYRITVFAGQRVGEIIELVAEASQIDPAEFEDALLNGTVTSEWVDKEVAVTLQSWEGLLFPDTYEFANEANAVQILQRLSDTMEQRMSLIDWTGLEAMGFTPYEGMVMASIIESEVRLPDERPLVAGVIINRISDGMILQMDSTVLYALDTRDITEFDPGFDSPYNTYREAGLPPTPISAPSFASLRAASEPADTEFRYFVLSSTDGRHTFSVTLEQHEAAVRQSRADGVLP